MNGGKRGGTSTSIATGRSLNSHHVEKPTDEDMVTYPQPVEITQEMPVAKSSFKFTIYDFLNQQQMLAVGEAATNAQATEKGITWARLVTKVIKNVEAETQSDKVLSELSAKNFLFRNDITEDYLGKHPLAIVRSWLGVVIHEVLKEVALVLTNESHPLRRSLEDQAKRGKLEPRQLLGCHVQNLLLCEGVVSQQFLPKLLKDLVDENHLEKLRPTKPKDRFMPSGKDMGPIGKNHSYSFSNHCVHKDNRNRRLAKILESATLHVLPHVHTRIFHSDKHYHMHRRRKSAAKLQSLGLSVPPGRRLRL